jgi:hypothetical protein
VDPAGSGAAPGASQSVVADARVARIPIASIPERLLRVGGRCREQDRGNKNFIACHDTFPFAGIFSLSRGGISSHKPKSSPSSKEANDLGRVASS